MKQSSTYFSQIGGMPKRNDFLTKRAIFEEAYILIPKGCIRDIVSSFLPNWEATRAWILAQPLSGFIETYSYYVMEVDKRGGSKHPEPNKSVESVLFGVSGKLILTLESQKIKIQAGTYVFLPPGIKWTIENQTNDKAYFHWIRKNYEKSPGLDIPSAFFVEEQTVVPQVMPNDPKWKTSRFVDPLDLRHDMHVNIVTFEPGGSIPFPETHVMEHAIYVLQGRGTYYLNGDWQEVEAGDFMAVRSFCPQACQAIGQEPFRYLLYKNVNRHVAL